MTRRHSQFTVIPWWSSWHFPSCYSTLWVYLRKTNRWSNEGKMTSQTKWLLTGGSEGSPAGLPEALRGGMELDFRQFGPRKEQLTSKLAARLKPDMHQCSGLQLRLQPWWDVIQGKRNESVIKSKTPEYTVLNYKPEASVNSHMRVSEKEITSEAIIDLFTNIFQLVISETNINLFRYMIYCEINTLFLICMPLCCWMLRKW